MRMRLFYLALILVVTVSSCIGNPPSSVSGRPSDRPLPERKTTKVTSSKLDVRVARLASEIERKGKTWKFTEEDVTRWVEKIEEYYLEYTLSTSSLSDAQCESIEYNFGKIAGLLYNMIAEPLEAVSDELEQYEERSERWAGAAERGFESVAKFLDDIE